MTTLFHKTAPVQAAILVEMIRMLQEASRDFTMPVFPTAPVKPEPPSESYRLKQAGFTNAKPIADYERLTKQYEKAMKKWRKRTDAVLEVTEMRNALRRSVEVLIDARQKFGPDTLLINYADFERIMRRYNLVCGPFENYTGAIPMAKLEEIEQLKRNYRNTRPIYINRLDPLIELRVDSDSFGPIVPGYLKRFPFVKHDNEYYGLRDRDRKDFHGNKINSRNWEFQLGAVDEFFICAPKKDMKTFRKVYSPMRYNDPFICAHTDYGILVFTRWGEEAGDALVKKYERVNQLLDGLSLPKSDCMDCSERSRRGGFSD
jgi:hypothetical protein